MIHLAWEQKENLQIVLTIPVSGGVKAFLLDLSAVNFLVATRKVSLYIKTGDSKEEQCFRADFQGLKPALVQTSTEISVPILSNQHNITTDYCAISRGEGYQEHWLSPNGWGENCHRFVITPTTLKGETRQTGTQSHGAGIVTANCPYCKALLTGMEYKCPRCGNQLKAAAPVQYKRATPNIASVPQEFPLRVVKPATEADTKKTSRYFLLFLVFSLINLVLFFIHFNIEYANVFDVPDDAFMYSMLMSCLIFNCFLLSHIFLLALIYRMWGLIQDQPCRTTPGVAIWLLLMPFWQLGWAFKAVRGLTIDVNNYYKNLDPTAQTALLSPFYASLLCILAILSFVSIIAFLFASRSDAGWEIIRLGFFISTSAFFILLIPFGAGLRSAYGKIAELKK